MTGTRSLNVPFSLNRGPGGPKPTPVRSQAEGSREILLSQSSGLQERARLSAEAGDVTSAAQFILQALDHERRAGGLGPQVLQLIKPR